MKLFILTSSIFYLLGIKMSQNIESAPKKQEINPTPNVQEKIDTKHDTEKEEEKNLYLVPKEDFKNSDADSDVNSFIKTSSTHLIEKMD